MNKVSEYSYQVQSSIKRLLEDPLTDILLNNSNLTRIQLQTLLIELLSEKISGIKLNYEQKAKLRLKDNVVSRGSFNRTLKQAKINTNKSINTILLLGYIGIFQTPQLQPFIEISNKLNIYIKQYITLWKRQKANNLKKYNTEVLLTLKNELINDLKALI